MDTDDELREALSDLLQHEGLTKWEESFIESICDDNTFPMTPGQRDKAVEILEDHI